MYKLCHEWDLNSLHLLVLSINNIASPKGLNMSDKGNIHVNRKIGPKFFIFLKFLKPYSRSTDM